MKIAWFCIPAWGHTNPTLAVVKELCAAGHAVYYFSFDMLQSPIEQAGAVFISCDGCDLQMENSQDGDRVGKDIAYAARLLVSSTLALDDMTSRKIAEIQPDLIVSDSVAYWGKLAAMKHQIPYVSSTTTFAFNRYSSKYMEHSLWDLGKMLFATPKVHAQIKRLQEKGYPVKGILEIIQNDNDTNTLVYTSKYFQPCGDTFSNRYCFIGPSMRPVVEPMKKTARKTVYISLGTVVHDDAFLLNCIEAVKDSDWQVILSTGGRKIPVQEVPSHIQILERVDQMAVLSIADAFVTHCGMNSVNEALYNGVPLVLFPQTPEQAAVARRVQELGAGLRLENGRAADIYNAIHTVMENPAYKENAEKISESFQACKGAKQAREFLEEVVRQAE